MVPKEEEQKGIETLKIRIVVIGIQVRRIHWLKNRVHRKQTKLISQQQSIVKWFLCKQS